MKYFLLFIVLLSACTKSKKTAELHDFVCYTSTQFSYRSQDTTYFLAHGPYRNVSVTTWDTLYSIDSTARLNYMFSADNYIPNFIFYSMSVDTAIYTQKRTSCDRSPYLN